MIRDFQAIILSFVVDFRKSQKKSACELSLCRMFPAERQKENSEVVPNEESSLFRFENKSLWNIACNGKSGKAYIRIFEDCVKNCHAVPNRPGEFKGAHYEIRELEVETKNSSGESTGYETREFEVEYSVWYKFVD